MIARFVEEVCAPAAAAFLATTVAVLILMRLAAPMRLVDVPDGRHAHERPTPRIGGLALAWGLILVFIAANLGLDVSSETGVSAAEPRRETWGAAAMLALGVADDALRDRFRWYWKLAGQIAVCAWYALPWGWPEGLAIAGFLVIAVNAMNWFDHANILLAAAAIPGACILPGHEAGLLVGGLAALLLFNARGRVFAGDGGSHGLGFWIASSAIVARGPYPAHGLGLAAIVLSLPLFDFVAVIATRARKGIRPWIATHDHLADRLSRRSPGLRSLAPVGALAWGLLGGGAILALRGHDVPFDSSAAGLVGLAAVLVFLGSPPFRPRAPASIAHQASKPPG
jgi:UDP-N-acetylmuramyl pentapeptide phosphotransferase/UDP-N-acetylglucosamine-1-phosphate transferase